MFDAITNACPNLDAGWANQPLKVGIADYNYILQKNGFNYLFIPNPMLVLIRGTMFSHKLSLQSKYTQVESLRSIATELWKTKQFTEQRGIH